MFRLTMGATLIAAAFFANTAVAGHDTIKPKAYLISTDIQASATMLRSA